MPRDFRLTDLEDVHKIADTDFPVGDEIKQAKPGAIGQDTKEKIEGERFFFPGHAPIIYALTDMSNGA